MTVFDASGRHWLVAPMLDKKRFLPLIWSRASRCLASMTASAVLLFRSSGPPWTPRSSLKLPTFPHRKATNLASIAHRSLIKAETFMGNMTGGVAQDRSRSFASRRLLWYCQPKSSNRCVNDWDGIGGNRKRRKQAACTLLQRNSPDPFVHNGQEPSGKSTGADPATCSQPTPAQLLYQYSPSFRS